MVLSKEVEDILEWTGDILKMLLYIGILPILIVIHVIYVVSQWYIKCTLIGCNPVVIFEPCNGEWCIGVDEDGYEYDDCNAARCHGSRACSHCGTEW